MNKEWAITSTVLYHEKRRWVKLLGIDFENKFPSLGAHVIKVKRKMIVGV